MPTNAFARIAALGALTFAALSAGLLAAAIPAGAQRPAPAAVTAADSALFLEAQRHVSEGRRAEGRRLVDSVLAASPEGSPRYVEALYWRAVHAAKVEDAERDYRRVWLEYPLSARAPDALVLLAQVEMARGERDLAMRHLERLTREYPNSPALPRASYWIARVLFESNDVARACDALATARATAPATDVELRNQIDFHAKRCDSVGVAAAPTPSSRPATSRPAPAQTAQQPASRPATRPAAPSRGVPTPPTTTATTTTATRPGVPAAAPTTAARPTPRETPAVDTVPAPATRTTTAAPPPRPRADSVAPSAAPASPPADTARPSADSRVPAEGGRVPSAADSAASRPRAESREPRAEDREPRAAPQAPRTGQYAVQVAAYDTEAAARSLVTRLTARGLDAYLVSAQGVHRVRIGHYATRADALAALRELREKKIEGFVVP